MVESLKPREHFFTSCALRTAYRRRMCGSSSDARAACRVIEKDPVAFLADLDDPRAEGARSPRPTAACRALPGFRRWIWDGEASGSIGFRWQKGTAALPSHVLGHIGYAVVPWKRRRVGATEALR